jgi:hypothetical protein
MLCKWKTEGKAERSMHEEDAENIEGWRLVGKARKTTTTTTTTTTSTNNNIPNHSSGHYPSS